MSAMAAGVPTPVRPWSTSTMTPTRVPAAVIASERPRAVYSESAATVSRVRGARAASLSSLILPHEVVGDEDVPVDAAVDHDLGLAELLADDAHGAAVHLHARDGQALVGLDVGPQADVVRVAVGLGAVEVLLQGVEVDEQEGGVEVVDVHGRSVERGAHDRPARLGASRRVLPAADPSP